MTDEREMRERAAQLLKGFKFECGASSNPTHYYIEFAVAFAAAERDAAVEECCKAICSYCRDEITLDGDSHRYANGTFMDVCRARAIRSRVAAKGEKSDV